MGSMTWAQPRQLDDGHSHDDAHDVHSGRLQLFGLMSSLSNVLHHLPAQSPPGGLSASGSMGNAGILVGSHGHFGSLQSQSPAKKIQPVNQVSMPAKISWVFFRSPPKLPRGFLWQGIGATVSLISNSTCYWLRASRDLSPVVPRGFGSQQVTSHLTENDKNFISPLLIP